MDLFDFKEVKYLERDTNTPTFFGKIDSEVGKGGQVMITLGDRNFFVDINPQDGSWKWTPPEALTDGEYSLSFMTIDTAGNLSTPTQRTLIVDTTPPVAPTLLNLYDDQGAITGSFDAGKMTDDRRPTLTGIAEKGTVVYLKEGNTVIGSAKADEKTGLWTLEPNVDLADGRHNLTLVAAETFADKLREGKPSDEFSVIVGKDDEVPDNAAKIIDAVDNVGSLTGLLENGGITDDTTPELRGRAPEGSVVLIQYRNDKGEWIDGGNAVMNGNSWSWTPSPALGVGSWEFRANAGSDWSETFKLEINYSTEIEASITHAYDNAGPYTGVLGNGAVTDDTTPTFHGRAESNSIVYIHFRDLSGQWQLLGSSIAAADGSWEYVSDRMTAGEYQYQASNSATRDTSQETFDLKIIAPNSLPLSVENAWDDVGYATGKLKSGDTTNDSQPDFYGVYEANATFVIVLSNSSTGEKLNYQVMTDNTGHWKFTPPHELSKGTWNVNINDGETGSFKLNITDTMDPTVIHEDFSELSLGPITSPININGATLTGYYGPITVIDQPGRQIKLGGGTTADTAMIVLELDNYASELSFNLMGIENAAQPAYIRFFGPDGNEIHSMNAKNMAWTKYEFIATDTLISKVSIAIYSEPSGVHIDDLRYVAVEPKLSQNNVIDESEQIITHALDGIAEINDFDQINISDILAKGSKNLFIENDTTQLMVNGNQGDTVRLEDILPEGSEQNGWAEQAGTVTIAGTQYHVWSNGDAELLVQDGVKTELV
ncbi:Ig-like domain-containing protein [Pantoea dispersa]|uniref:Ig-like domain-containing protein n=1 Tax=Pantoea dispersa TaxID=59814 RepID=UPI0021AFA465|nr:Ig-like domain-containing protein [Pantoea dispersa]MCT6590787.1 Ig-like domain-containing protein [Pantoea dispersa]